MSEAVSHRHGLRERAIGLTFDDGPSGWTQPILELLRAYGARATFFVLGSAVAGREETIRAIVSGGHELGNHGFTHRPMTTLDDDEVCRELLATREALRAITPAPVRFWRPPYVQHDERVRRLATSCGFPELAGFSIDPEDYRSSADEICTRVLDQLQPGSIVDLHDGRPSPDGGSSSPTREATVAAVERLLPVLSSEGYRALTLSELCSALR